MHVQYATLGMGCHPGTTDSSYPIIVHPKQAPGIPKDQIQTSKMTTNVVLEFIAGFEPNLPIFLLLTIGYTDVETPNGSIHASPTSEGNGKHRWFTLRFGWAVVFAALGPSVLQRKESGFTSMNLHQLLPKTVWSFSPEKKWQRYHWWDAIVILWLGWALGGFICAHTSPCRSAYICACFWHTIRWYASAKHTYLIFFGGWRGVQLTKHLQKISQMSTNSCVFKVLTLTSSAKRSVQHSRDLCGSHEPKKMLRSSPWGEQQPRLATPRWKTVRIFWSV